MNYHSSSSPDATAGRMHRRHWIAAAAAGYGLVITGGHLARAEPNNSEHRRFRVGCSGRSFHRELPAADRSGKMSLDEFIGRCSQWDCDCVELLDVSFPQTDDAFLASLKREAFLKSIDLSAASVYTDFLQSKTAARDAELDKVRQWIDRTARLGASLLVVYPGPKRRDLPMSEAVRRVTDALLRLTDHAQQRGVMLGLENHGMFNLNAECVLETIEKVNHPWVAVNLDTGNFIQDPYENMAALIPKAVNCHLKLDTYSGKNKIPADLPRKFRILREGGYRGRITLQYELSGDPFVEVPKYLKQIQALANPAKG